MILLFDRRLRLLDPQLQRLLLRVGNLRPYEYYIAWPSLICLEVRRRVLGPCSDGRRHYGFVFQFGNASWLPVLLRVKGFKWTYIAGYCYSLEGIFGLSIIPSPPS
jgi:hypothetical protein